MRTTQNTVLIHTSIGKFECKEFYDVDTNQAGIDISIDDEYIGSMLGRSLPDGNDEEEVINFTDQLETWVIDHQYDND